MARPQRPSTPPWNRQIRIESRRPFADFVADDIKGVAQQPLDANVAGALRENLDRARIGVQRVRVEQGRAVGGGLEPWGKTLVSEHDSATPPYGSGHRGQTTAPIRKDVEGTEGVDAIDGGRGERKVGGTPQEVFDFAVERMCFVHPLPSNAQNRGREVLEKETRARPHTRSDANGIAARSRSDLESASCVLEIERGHETAADRVLVFDERGEQPVERRIVRGTGRFVIGELLLFLFLHRIEQRVTEIGYAVT